MTVAIVSVYWGSSNYQACSRALDCFSAVALKTHAGKNRKNEGILLFLKLVHLYLEGKRKCKFT
jgi:hypothetical protein